MTDHRRLLTEGDPDAWASPLTPLSLLLEPTALDLLDGARACAVITGSTPRPDLVTLRETLCRVLGLWWASERDARILCRYLGDLGSAGGQGSPAHRRAVLVAALCARTVTHLIPDAADRAEIASVLDAVTEWAHGRAEKIDLAALRQRAWAVRRQYAYNAADADADAAAAYAADAAADDAASADAADAAYAAYASAADAADAAAADADAYGSPEWPAARARALAALADLIRSEIPECPGLETP